MKIVINLILLLITVALGYMLVNSIREPIAFQEAKDKREQAVINRLMDIRKAQEMFRDIKGGFAPNFDTLQYVLENDSFAIIKIEGDEDATGADAQAIRRDTTYKSALDSIRAMGLRLDSLRHVPYSNKMFDIAADTLTYQQTLVSVVEVGTKRSYFMGKYADDKYARYDNSYNPNTTIKFGDMNSPKLAGNWESK
ncbi:MAG: hypothetical protein AAGI23_04530 [Bacteroidota bacterium]